MLTQARLKELLRYDPETGVFTWRVQNSPRAQIGAPAGCVKKGDCDYRVVRVDCQLYRANRLAWFYMTGTWPELQVDHEDRNPLNDAWRNLRLATNKQNGENASLRKDNTSGHPGVKWRTDTLKWSACIKHHRKTIHLGCFAEKDAAIAARISAEQRLFTHSRYSRCQSPS